jgi:tRNA(Arg) A34 adenosine deaminase TadA
MNDEESMTVAIDLAKKDGSLGGSPFASIIVKDGKVVATGISTVSSNLDPVGHGDANAISEAGKTLRSLDLTGCILYSTIEPCAMCVCAAAWAGITRVVFGAYQEDIPGNDYLLKDYHAEAFTENLVTSNGEKIKVQGGVLRRECAKLMENIKNWQPVYDDL